MGWVWGALIVATMVLFALIARALVGKARALGGELGRAGQASDRLDRAPGPGWTSPGPTMYDDDIELRARVARQRARRHLRRAARLDRHRRTWARWQDNVE